MLFGNALTDAIEYKNVENLIHEYIDPDTMMALMYLCLRYDIPDNNTKAEIVKELLGPDFVEIGTGTNRIAFRHNGLIVKVALDRRGQIDNYTEYKRSMELPEFLAKVYESNYLINICEYVEVMDQDKFLLNEGPIKMVLKEISKNYLFEDVGFTMKNSYNWGCREARLTDDERFEYGDSAEYIYDVCILDYGYLYPISDQKETLFKCPKCGQKLKWNSNYTMIQCSGSCTFQISPTGLRRRMKLDYENLENKIMSNLNSHQMPNLDRIEQEITKVDR